MAFARRFAPLRGAAPALPDDEEFLAAAHPGSPLELLLGRGEWREAWLGAELADARRQLEAACEAYGAWRPAAEQLAAAAGGEEDLVPDTPRSGWVGWGVGACCLWSCAGGRRLRPLVVEVGFLPA
jgi:hypothetical protein